MFVPEAAATALTGPVLKDDCEGLIVAFTGKNIMIQRVLQELHKTISSPCHVGHEWQ